MPDAEAREVLNDEGARSSSADDSDLLAAEDLLTTVAEEPGLAVVRGIGDGTAWRLSLEHALRTPGNMATIQHDARPPGSQMSPATAFEREDEGTDRQSVSEIEEGRVATFVGREVVH